MSSTMLRAAAVCLSVGMSIGMSAVVSFRVCPINIFFSPCLCCLLLFPSSPSSISLIDLLHLPLLGSCPSALTYPLLLSFSFGLSVFVFCFLSLVSYSSTVVLWLLSVVCCLLFCGSYSCQFAFSLSTVDLTAQYLLGLKIYLLLQLIFPPILSSF